MVGARLQVHVQGGVLGHRTAPGVQAVYFGMRSTMCAMPSFGKDAVSLHKHSPHHGIRCHFTRAQGGQFKTSVHPARVHGGPQSCTNGRLLPQAQGRGLFLHRAYR
jgi:hypothetical protein